MSFYSDGSVFKKLHEKLYVRVPVLGGEIIYDIDDTFAQIHADNKRVETAMKLGYLKALLELNGGDLEVHFSNDEGNHVGIRILKGVQLFGVSREGHVELGYESDEFLP